MNALKQMQNDLYQKIENQAQKIAPKEHVIKDGVLNIATYEKLPLKLMFILKEAVVDNEILYDDLWEKATDQAIINVSKYASLRNRVYLTACLLNQYLHIQGIPNTPNIHVDDLPYIRQNVQYAQSLCAVANINIGKIKAESYNTSPQKLSLLWNQWNNIVEQQITGYNPDVLFLCGTFIPEIQKFLSTKYSLKEEHVGDGWKAFSICMNNQKKLLFKTYHPAYGKFSTPKYMDSIIDFIRTRKA